MCVDVFWRREAFHRFDHDKDAHPHQDEAIGKGGDDFEPTQAEGVSLAMLLPVTGSNAQTKVGDQQRRKVNKYMTRIAEQCQTVRDYATNKLYQQHNGCQDYRYANRSDVGMLTDVVMMVVTMPMTVFMSMVMRTRRMNVKQHCLLCDDG